jgi:uncharacterized protein YndB with AHSA1/START domain
MKRLALTLAALVVAAGVAVIVVGAFLPRTHRVASETTVRRPPDEVWRRVRDLASMPRWCPDVETSVRVADQNGHERWQQRVSGFDVLVEVVQEEAPRSFATRILTPSDSTAFGGRWTYELEPQPGGGATRVRVTEDGWIGPWPFRTLAWGFGYHEAIDRCLGGLASHFGQPVDPIHVEPAPSAFSGPPASQR